MQPNQPCQTLQLAADILIATRTVEVAGSRPDTFDASALTRVVQDLARQAGATRHQLFVAMVDDRGAALIHEVDPAGHFVGSRNVPPGQVPFAPAETWADRMLLVTIIGERPSEAFVRVENFEDRVRQGWRLDSPAMVTLSVNGSSAGYAHMGVELTDLVGQPVGTVAGGEPHGLAADGKHLFVDPGHPEVVDMLTAAELAGETVMLSSGALPGIHLLRSAGAAVYELVGDADREAALMAVANSGGAVVTAKLHQSAQGSRYVAARHVGHVIDGTEPGRPAVCRSVVGMDGNAPSVSLTLATRGKILVEGLDVERSAYAPR